MGGTLSHLVFAKIAQNFAADDPEARQWVDLVFEAEDLLMDAGEISSDYVVGVCGPRLPLGRTAIAGIVWPAGASQVARSTVVAARAPSQDAMTIPNTKPFGEQEPPRGLWRRPSTRDRPKAVPRSPRAALLAGGGR